VVVRGGLGPHKWLDRTLLEAHEADDPATLPLLLDADGYVLEASRASIVVRAADARLYTRRTTAASCPASRRGSRARLRAR
jgi:branched-subunit amino acid aminotransferase/4-amino-4-deoxychorismate lyase